MHYGGVIIAVDDCINDLFIISLLVKDTILLYIGAMHEYCSHHTSHVISFELDGLACSKLEVCLANFYNKQYASYSKQALFSPGMSKFTTMY